jgi:hypothetical protein
LRFQAIVASSNDIGIHVASLPKARSIAKPLHNNLML